MNLHKRKKQAQKTELQPQKEAQASTIPTIQSNGKSI